MVLRARVGMAFMEQTAISAGTLSSYVVGRARSRGGYALASFATPSRYGGFLPRIAKVSGWRFELRGAAYPLLQGSGCREGDVGTLITLWIPPAEEGASVVGGRRVLMILICKYVKREPAVFSVSRDNSPVMW
jgi:hypothetical protein